MAVNRIHPDTYTVINPYHDYKKLGQLMTEVEHKHQFFVTPQGGVNQSRKSEGAKSSDSHGDLSFSAWCREKVPAIFMNVSSWQEAHSELSKLGVQIVPYGKGMVFQSIENELYTVKASSVGRDFSASKLSSRLGDYEPHREPVTSQRASHDSEENQKPNQKSPSSKDQRVSRARNDLGDGLERWFGRKRSSWESLHRLMHKNGYAIAPYRQGLSVLDKDGQRIAASKIDRKLSRSFLETRIGAFEHPQSELDQSPDTYSLERSKRPRNSSLAQDDGLWSRYQGYRDQMPTKIKMRRELGAEIRKIRKHAQNERAEVFSSISSPSLRAAYRRDIQWQTIRQIQGERLRQQALFEQACKEVPPLDWREWLVVQAQEGNMDALSRVRANNMSSHQLSGNPNAISSIDDQNSVEAIQRILNYKVQIDRKGVINYRDSHHALILSQYRTFYRVHDSRSETVNSAVRMAIDSYGPRLRLTGDEAFKRQAVREIAAIEQQDGRRISLTDERLQNYLEEERRKLEENNKNKNRLR